MIDDTFVGGLLGGTGLTAVPVLGSFHAFDVLFYLFATLPAATSNNVVNIMSTWISFIHDLNPNNHGLDLPNWPQYNQGSKKLYHFQETGPNVITDTYRTAPMNFINQNAADLEI